MKMGVETRELFFYETFLYYNSLLLIVSYISSQISRVKFFKCVSSCMLFCSDTDGLALGVNFWLYSRSGVDYAAIFYPRPDHLSHKEIWKVVFVVGLCLIQTLKLVLVKSIED
ncbi:hypothetical protein AtEden1_Chr2g0230481 [Arabidopsis thaliana]